jgi:hypothetical protein
MLVQLSLHTSAQLSSVQHHVAGCVMQVCRTAATDAAGHAERAKAAAESASAAVQRCRLSVGDASVSAEAEATASKAGKSARQYRYMYFNTGGREWTAAASSTSWWPIECTLQLQSTMSCEPQNVRKFHCAT